MQNLYPSIPSGRWPAIIRITLVGAVVAGAYGAVHDQVSYSISPEYFTKLKFHQFSYADFGWPPRVFVAEIGFLASFGVGLLGGWVVARLGLAEIPAPAVRTRTVRTFGIVLSSTMLGGVIGAILGLAVTRNGVPAGWDDLTAAGVEDPQRFVVVAYLHAGSYLGALVGLVMALVTARRFLAGHRRLTAPGATPRDG
jgi:hypothetical protein